MAPDWALPDSESPARFQQWHPCGTFQTVETDRSIDLISARLQAGRHRAIVVAAILIAALRAATGLRRIEAGLAFRPIVAFIAISRLLIGRLATLRVDDQIPLGGCRRRSGRGLIRACGRLDDDIAVLRRVP